VNVNRFVEVAMLEVLRAFQEHRQFFLELVVPICQESDEYRELDAKRLGEVLLLADRVVAAYDQHQDNARVADLAKQLQEAVGESQAEALLVRLELWLKGLWWLVDPSGWRQARDEGEMAAARRKRNGFNLVGTIVRLELLTNEEV